MHRDLLWTLPFISFISGYWILSMLLHSPIVQTPAIVGTRIGDAVTQLCANDLNIKILTHVTDKDIPDGTIVSQSPQAGKPIKQQQSVYVIVAKHPPVQTAPPLVGKHQDAIAQELTGQEIPYKIYPAPGTAPAGECISQHPAPGTPLGPEGIIIYCAQQRTKPVIMPDLINRPLAEVQEFLLLYGITPTVFHSQERTGKQRSPVPIVIDQKPLAGSIIILDEKTNIQLLATN